METWGDYCKRVGENLKRIRTAKGIKKKELARLSGVSRPSITYYEQGKRCMTIYVAELIAQALEVEVQDLIKE